MSMSQADSIKSNAQCEIRTDLLTRQLHATDASIYQIEPLAVAFPKTAEEASSAIQAAADVGVPVTMRGAGTGLTGGAVGSGLVIDVARYNRGITEFDPERRTLRVGPGVVLDQLNDFLKPHGLCFGPDVATSSRATLGGMIGNNSSGARAPIYGVTSDHLASLDVVLADGRVATVASRSDGLADVHERIGAVVDANAAVIDELLPDTLVKRWSGYGIDRYRRKGGDLMQIVSGSEGTLAAVTSAVVKAVPLPKEKGLALLFFDSVADAMQATVDILDLKPAAIEHVDLPLLDQTHGQLAFRATRDLLRLDEAPCSAFLIVEFYDDVNDRLNALAARNLGTRHMLVTDPKQMDMVWGLRKAGLSLLTGRKGPAKPIAGLEDVAIDPAKLPEYVAALEGLMNPLGLKASFYGHAASGLLHVRPIVDLHRQDDIEKFRTLADEVSAVVKEFKGSIAAEHGVGIARTQYLEEQLGPELMNAMRAIKEVFDPKGILNPGKVIGDGTFTIESHLRMGDGYALNLPFDPVLKFVARDESFVANLEQCNGCGGCRKDAPTMCPTYQATGEEIMSTRGRANTIRAVLDGRIEGHGDLLRIPELDEALSNCLACKACKTECPSNVDMALLKAELLHAKQRKNGVSLREFVIGSVDLMSRLGCLAPRLANATMNWGWVRTIMERVTGISARRSLPAYTGERFDRWFARHLNPHTPTRGKVILWDDTFVRFNEPDVGKAAVRVLEAAGYEVELLKGKQDSGRPSFSVGRLGRAKRLGRHNINLIAKHGGDAPVVFLEPSVYSMFASDYGELGIEGADTIAKRCVLFEEFVLDLVEREPDALEFRTGAGAVAVHGHCHTKALTDGTAVARLAKLLPEVSVSQLETGCCGMAGSFGVLKSKYDLSVQVAQPLVDQIDALAEGTKVVACGTSCRHQIGDLTDARPQHIAELVANALA
ncbi:MAG: FAD-binding protein [bacterium]|nr:FAD-binding protein [bacterium]